MNIMHYWLDKLRRIHWRSFFIQLLLIVLIISAVSWYQQRDTVRGKAPEIRDSLLSGQSVQLSQYLGRPMILHFWASWCPVCKLESGSINELAKDYPLLSIASWSAGKEAVAKFMADEDLSMPVIVDDAGHWAAVYGVKAVPTSLLIDAEGNIRFVQTGYSTELGLRLRMWWLENY